MQDTTIQIDRALAAEVEALPLARMSKKDRFALVIRRGLAQEQTANNARLLALDDARAWLEAHHEAALQRGRGGDLVRVLLNDMGAIGGGK